jgi:hypothetical protein
MSRRPASGGRAGPFAAVGVAILAAACTVVDATPDKVVVQFNSYYPGWAFNQASRHCGQFGREAVLIGSRPGEPSWRTGFTGTTIQTFECAPPAPAAGSAAVPGDPPAPPVVQD